MGYLLAFAAVILASFNFVGARLVAEAMQPALLGMLRWLIAVLILAPLLIRMVRGIERVQTNARQCVLAGVLGIAILSLCIYTAAKTIDAITLGLLAASVGIFHTLGRLLLRHGINRLEIGGLILSVIGLITLISHGSFALLLNPVITTGQWWMLCGAAVWACYLILLEQRKPVNGLADHAGSIIAGLPFLGFLAVVETSYAVPIDWTKELGAVLVFLAVFPSIVCISLWHLAHTKLSAVKLRAIACCFPLAVAAEAALVLEERIYLYQGVAGALLIAGLLLCMLGSKRAGAWNAVS